MSSKSRSFIVTNRLQNTTNTGSSSSASNNKNNSRAAHRAQPVSARTKLNACQVNAVCKRNVEQNQNSLKLLASLFENADFRKPKRNMVGNNGRLLAPAVLVHRLSSNQLQQALKRFAAGRNNAGVNPNKLGQNMRYMRQRLAL